MVKNIIYIYSRSFAHKNNILVSGHVFQLKLLQHNKLNWWIFTSFLAVLWCMTKLTNYNGNGLTKYMEKNIHCRLHTGYVFNIIHINIYLERENFVKLCMCEMSIAACGLQGSEANNLLQTDQIGASDMHTEWFLVLHFAAKQIYFYTYALVY